MAGKIDLWHCPKCNDLREAILNSKGAPDVRSFRGGYVAVKLNCESTKQHWASVSKNRATEAEYIAFKHKS